LQLAQIESSVVDTGDYLKIDALPSTSGLTQEYNIVMSKIQQLSANACPFKPPFDTPQLSGLIISANTGLTAAQIAALTAAQTNRNTWHRC